MTRLGLVAFLLAGVGVALVVARELRQRSSTPVEWRTDGGELGQRVRAGAVPGVQHLGFRSEAVGEEIGLVVADPHDYGADGDREWPVVYFLNGFGSDEWGLFDSAPELLDELREFALVVTVNQGHSSGYGPAEAMISREVVAFVDDRRSTVTARSGRALVGHSLGGMGALYVGTRHPEIFGSIGAISSACYLVERCDTITEEILRVLADPAAGLERTAFVVSWGTAEDSRIVEFQEQVSLALSDERHGTIHRFVLAGVDHDFREQLAARVNSDTFGRELAASLASALRGR